MKIHSLMATVVFAGALATGCATTSTNNAAMEAEYQQAMAAAETARQQAATIGGEWRDTGKIMKQAEEAAAKGDYDTAVSLAEKARVQGVLGYEQAMSQQAAGPLF
jgi:hypothetical protein